MRWNSNLWYSKAEKEKYPEQKNTDFGILSESTIQISFIREIDTLKSHRRINQFINYMEKKVWALHPQRSAIVTLRYS